jgi:integrase
LSSATRIQTTDHGQPVSLYTVARELGHSSVTMIERVYGHLMQVRHRSPVVEYVEAAIIELARVAGQSA